MTTYFLTLLCSLVSAVVCDICAQHTDGAPSAAGKPKYSEWVFPDSKGKLAYKSTTSGDKIIDFSHAGYMGGGVALPSVPVLKTVRPSGGADDTQLIQQAIDEVSALPRKDGFRGAVLLAPGDYTCSNTITIWASGVVLYGSGTGANGTTIHMVGEKHSAFIIGARRPPPPPSSGSFVPSTRDEPTGGKAESVQTTIADAYIPSGARTLTVADVKGFSVGDTIVIRRPITPVWLKFMEMDNLRRNGRAQTFLSTSRSGNCERRIAAIHGNTITIDVPLSDSYDGKYLNPPGTEVVRSNLASSVSNVGVERLHIQCPPLEIKYSDAPYSAFRIEGDDCWIRDVYCEETMNTTAISGKRITLQQVVVTHSYPNLGASKPSDFSIQGCQILLDRCSASGGNTYFVWTGSLVSGPNVALNCSFSGYGSRLQPHQRWATGLLFDNCRIPDGGIDFMNRGVAGSGHGWTMGWGVAWNCLARTFIIQNPPGSHNWAIGCIGERQKTARLFDSAPILPEGVIDSHGQNVAPQSLYLAQLEERLGVQALTNLGYSSNSAESLKGSVLGQLGVLKYDNDEVFGKDLAMFRPVNASNVRGNNRNFGAEKALDGDPNTFWATDDGAAGANFEVDTEGPLEINAVEICEAPGLEGRVLEYKVEGQIDSDWQLLFQGTTIGKRKVDQFPTETVWKVRLTILKQREHPAIKKFALYKK